MYLSIVLEYLEKYWLYALLGVIGLILLIVFINLIYFTFFHKKKSFVENLNDIKYQQFTTVIDYEEKVVEKYYLYDQASKAERISLEEFFVKFDKANVEKFTNWLSYISSLTDFDKTRRIEVVMYDNLNSRSVYLVELENYHLESKRFYLNFKDITKTSQIQRRANKKLIVTDDEDFFEKVNDRLSVCDSNSYNFLVAIKFKEFQYALKELPSDLLTAVEESIYDAIEESKNDNDLLCLAQNGTYYLFSANVANIRKYRKNLKQMMIRNSGHKEVIENRFNYTITLVAGYTQIKQNEKFTIDKTLEAEAAVNVLMNKSRFSSDRVQLFDENLQKDVNITNNKLSVVEKVITQGLFSLDYQPLINVHSKRVSEYYVSVMLPHAINMQFGEFMTLAKQRSFRLAFYTKVFEMLLNNEKYSKKTLYFSFDFDNLHRVMEAYASNKEFKKLNIYFCISFSNKTMQNNNLINIEKSLDVYKKEHKVKFGIMYNTLTTVYLNTKIYRKADVIILSGDLVSKSLDTYENSFLIDIYGKVASSYSQDVIGLNVYSLAIYEMFMHQNVSKVGGSFLTPYVTENNRIESKSLLKTLNEIENRKY